MISAAAQRRAETSGRWLGAMLKVGTCWAAVHVALVADGVPRWCRALAGAVVYLAVRATARVAKLNQALSRLFSPQGPT